VLDAIKKREIIAILSVGCSRRVAARYVGCSPKTIQNTAERDPDFAEGLRQAEERIELTQLKNIAAAARKAQYWRAAAWMLERTRPQQYASRRPDVVTREQLARLMVRFAQIVAEDVTVSRDRKTVIKRLDRLAADLGCPIAPEGEDHEPAD
jgi:hypothetical protein